LLITEAVSPCFSEVFDIVSSKLVGNECILFFEGAHGNECDGDGQILYLLASVGLGDGQEMEIF
jgi:hypothetical protein